MLYLLLLLLCAGLSHSATTTSPTPAPTLTPEAVAAYMKRMDSVVEGLSRQVMLQQFYLEEKIRSDGNSGIKQVRMSRDGTRSFYEAAHVERGYLAMHDHANYARTVGMGEMLLAMNGVEFRTRHNDYKLRMPSRNSTAYHATEPIPFPPLPPSVTRLPNITDQIEEMREYFRAFRDQNVTHRDYRPFFRPVLCYIEAGWGTGTKALDEPFQSDRHQIDASSWFDLMEKIRFTSYSGSKSVLENFAFLPTTVMSVENGVPVYAQWNYRILCHPFTEDLPTKYFKPDDDLLYRFPNKVGVEKTMLSRSQRFHLNKEDVDHYNKGRGIMDDIMMQIPGKDNYPCDLHDNSFGMVMEDVRYSNHTLINTGYYHRYFKTMDQGAMGVKSVHRGYSDANLWVAQTTHSQIAPMSVEECKGSGRHKRCESWTQRYTYALPLEVIYLNPLQSWNPYNLAYDQKENDVSRNGRVGGSTTEKAFNGTALKRFYYLTPIEFYSSGRVQVDPADTAKPGAGVLGPDGEVHMMSSSGIRIVTPEIDGVGKIRMRYPIMPVHGEGSGVWKELNALKEMTMHMNRYQSLFEERPGAVRSNGTDESAVVHFRLSTCHRDPPGEHTHDFSLNVEEVDEIIHHKTRLFVTTSEAAGHSHDLELGKGDLRDVVRIKKCDGLNLCWDGHGQLPTVV